MKKNQSFYAPPQFDIRIVIYHPKTQNKYYILTVSLISAEDKVHILNQDGESGDFKADYLYEAIDKMFKKYF